MPIRATRSTICTTSCCTGSTSAKTGRARRYADRLGRMLAKAAASPNAVFPEECWALVCEARANIPQAIEHRRNVIRLIKRLHELVRGTAHEQATHALSGLAELSNQLDLLAVLYHTNEQLDEAIATLLESKHLCQTEGLTFDGEDLLAEFNQDKRQAEDRVA